MKRFKLIYWKKLKKDDVCLLEFKTIEEVDDFLNKNTDKYTAYIVCEFNKIDKFGVAHYTVLNRGFYVTFKVIINVISFTVMVAILASFFYTRNWLLSTHH